MVKAIFYIVGIMFSVQNAMALSLIYKFNVNSSGPDMYACNAGIRHQSSTICKIRGTDQTCQPSLECGPGQNCNINNCICTTGDDSNRADQLRAKYTDWTDHGYSDAGPVRSKSLIASGNWQSLFNDVDAWDYELTADDIANSNDRNLEFNLTSAAFGTEYFVDICYRGPRIDLPGSSGGIYSFSSSTYGNDSFGEMFPDGTLARYLELAELATKVQVECFDQPTAFQNPQVYGPVQMSGQKVTFATGVQLAALPTVLKFCKVRYFYSENAVNFRPNTTQRARMCTDTTIDEPEETINSVVQ